MISTIWSKLYIWTTYCHSNYIPGLSILLTSVYHKTLCYEWNHFAMCCEWKCHVKYTAQLDQTLYLEIVQ
jgi:hypothetical protein